MQAGIRSGGLALAAALGLALIAGACTDPGPGSASSPSRQAGSPPAADGPGAAAAPAGRQEPIDLRDVGYDRGDPRAPVIVIEFSDYGCPYCAQFALQTYPSLEEEFIRTGQVQWKYIPFELGTFPNGAEAARAAMCAAAEDQALFWPMSRRIYLAQREWRSARGQEVVDLFHDLAVELGLDQRRFDTCFAENQPGPRLARNNQLAARLGVRATPTFFVNGRRVQGALPLDQFRVLLRMAAGEAAAPR